MATHDISSIKIGAGNTWTAVAGDTYNILEYVAGDWDGAIILSDTPGSPINLNVPIAGITVVGTSFTDCHAAGGGVIDATNGGIDGGGNDANIVFDVPTTTTSTTPAPTTTSTTPAPTTTSTTPAPTTSTTPAPTTTSTTPAPTTTSTTPAPTTSTTPAPTTTPAPVPPTAQIKKKIGLRLEKTFWLGL